MALDPDMLAKPGDADLDHDLSCVVIDTILRLDNEVSFTWHGGTGWLTRPDGTTRDVLGVTGTTFFARCYQPGYEHILDVIVARLEAWSAAHTELRLTTAYGRDSLLAPDDDDPNTWMALPTGPADAERPGPHDSDTTDEIKEPWA